MIPTAIDPAFAPGGKSGTAIVADWSAESRQVARGLMRLVAHTPGLELTLVWDRQRPPAAAALRAARGARPRQRAQRSRARTSAAALLAAADVLVCPGWRRRASPGRPAPAAPSSSRRTGCWACVRRRPAPAGGRRGGARCWTTTPAARAAGRRGRRPRRRAQPGPVAERLESLYRGMLRPPPRDAPQPGRAATC